MRLLGNASRKTERFRNEADIAALRFLVGFSIQKGSVWLSRFYVSRGLSPLYPSAGASLGLDVVTPCYMAENRIYACARSMVSTLSI